MRVPKALIPGWSSPSGQPVPAGQGTAGLWLRGQGAPSITAPRGPDDVLPTGHRLRPKGSARGLRLCSGKWLWNNSPCSAHPTCRERVRVSLGVLLVP